MPTLTGLLLSESEERDRVVVGVHAGDQRALTGPDEGDVARRVARVDDDRRREAAGLARPPLAVEDVAGRVDDQDVGGAVAVQVGDEGRVAADEVGH